MKKLLIIVLISFALFGCTAQRSNVFESPKLPVMDIKPTTTIEKIKAQKTVKNRTEKAAKVKITYVPIARESVPEFERKAIKSAKTTQSEKKAFKISVENMPIVDFINLVFGKILKYDYYIDKSVNTMRYKVTLNIKRPVTKNEFLGIVLAILKQYSVSVVENDGVYFIKRGIMGEKEIATKYFVGKMIPENILPSEKIGVIVPFYYIKATVYAGILRRLALSKSAFIQVLPKENAIFIVDNAKYIKFALKYIDLFDRPSFTNKLAVLIKFNYISPSDFVKKIESVLPLQGIPIAKSLAEPGIIFRPLDDISSLFVLSPKRKWLGFVYFWKNKLDTVSALGDQPQLFVYYPKNRRASELAKIFTKVEVKTVKGKKVKKVEGTVFGNIKFTVDQERNAIVFMCTPTEYEKIKKVLEKLDKLPRQVFVQVTILEVTLTGDLAYGVEWYLKHTGRYNGILQTLGGLGIGANGLTYSVITNTKKFQALINAFARKNLINVLSSPSLIVMDNKQASINVGTQVPVVTSETSSAQIQTQGTTALLRTIEYRNTGVILTIKPTINSNGVVTMDISQTVSEPQTNTTSKIDSPLILTREINTTVDLKSGATLLLGGLIKKSRSITINKVPIFGDIPILGNLFKTTSKGSIKTELIVEVTPYILPDIVSAQRISSAYRKMLKLLK